MEGRISNEALADKLREAVPKPLVNWRELYEGFAPRDVETGERMRRIPPPEELDARLAAVLVPVLMESDGPHIVYTVRRGHLNDHAGQISFPGGSMEPDDDSLLETALREAEEEIDLGTHLVEVVGEMEDMYIPPSNFLVKPFVGLLPPEAELTLAPDEVEEIFTVPLETLLAPKTLQTAILHRDDREYEVPVFAVENSSERKLWGATAAMTAALLARLGWDGHP
ncbi:MAG: CoA pyrophosphatase [Rubrobacter sp.]|jgi:8-oxo-dGTP pyrophosphatase MutT (NUDIX family)|nr:CoA pyrophosphatase [Rubrobacter sp.]